VEELGVAGHVLGISGVGVDAVEEVGLLVIVRGEEDEVYAALKCLRSSR
jgi:hypothetical protein